MTGGSWRQTCAFETNTLISAFQRCGCALPAHARSTIQIQGLLQYGAVPHIWPSIQGISSSYPWGSPVLWSYPYIGKGIQPLSSSLCNSLFRYASRWTHPDPLIQYRPIHGQQYPGIGRAYFFLHLLDQTFLRYCIGHQRRFVTFLVLYLINSCIQDWIIVSSANWNPVLVPQTPRQFSKIRPISIYWYHQLHV